jgi:SAM-dependent methyltransferase
MEHSEYGNIARLEDCHWWYVAMRRIAMRIVCALPLPAGALILDAGCGVGGGLQWLAAYGIPFGIDMHSLAVQYAGQISRRVARASIQSLPFADPTFCLVTSFDVLYHLSVTDDLAAFQELARVLRPGGWLLVRVPAYDWLRGAHDHHVHTRHRYSRNELKGKIESAGLEVKKITSVGITLLPAALFRRLTERRDQIHSDVVLPPLAINRLLMKVLSFEGTILERFSLPAGLSLMAIARKGS